MSRPRVILRLLDANEARLVCGLLDSYGIPASLASDSLPPTVYPTNVGVMQISVPEEDVEEALRILAAHRPHLDTSADKGDAHGGDEDSTGEPRDEGDGEDGGDGDEDAPRGPRG